MPLPRRLSGAVAILATAALLSAPTGAAARAGDRTFAQTFPVASVLCAKVAAGTERAHLRRFAPRILVDCNALLSAFTAAQATVLAVRAQLEPQLTADRTAVTAACPRPLARVQSRVCRRTHRLEDRAITALSLQLMGAARRYSRTVEAARVRFWSDIRGLPGERHARPDRPIPLLNG